MNKFSELVRRLSGVTAKVIDLTGSGLHKEDRIVFHNLLNGRVDDPRMRGTDGIYAAFSRDSIVLHDILQSSAGVAAVLSHWLQSTLPKVSCERVQCVSSMPSGRTPLLDNRQNRK